MRVRSHLLQAVIVAIGVGLITVALVASIMNRADYREIAFVSQPLALRASNVTGEITSAAKIVQTFRAKRDNLAAVFLFMSNYGHPNGSSVVLTVVQAPSQKVVRVSKALPGTVLDNRYHRFAFPPIPGSKNQAFHIIVTAPDGIPGGAVTAWLSDENPYPQGTVFVNGTRRERQDLVLTLNYWVGDSVVELVNRASQYKPAFFKGRNLKLLAILALLTTVIAVGFVAVSVLSTSTDSRAVETGADSPPQLE